jgi:LuxR family maltose regulon positive regulatory protein
VPRVDPAVDHSLPQFRMSTPDWLDQIDLAWAISSCPPGPGPEIAVPGVLPDSGPTCSDPPPILDTWGAAVYNGPVPTPILATKLYVPPPRAPLVLRPRLIERLNEGLHSGLTLIAAPAGFGKSTLLSAWITERTRHDPKLRVAWLSLDEGDSDPSWFLLYLAAALHGAEPSFGANAMAALQSPQPPSAKSILTDLINEIDGVTGDIFLVLDDYHAVHSPEVDDALAFLLEHLPAHMRLIIATREDPRLPLARLRARGELSELRAADLRFSPDEAADFLRRVMGLELSAQDIAALESRTEGWIAGLQLAALSMRGREDIAGFIRSFTGSHRFVLDYLVEAVLRRQPDEVRSFLLQTSILDRFCARLCDAVTERLDSRDTLELLDRCNLFLIPLDDKRQWYRYHHLFADVLRAHLAEAQPEQVSSLHRRASAWHGENGSPPDAIQHALAARDFPRAADLIELAWSAMDLNYQSSIWLGWVRALPGEFVTARPVLSLGYGWALLESGQLEASEARLQDAERWLEAPTDRMIVVDREQFRSLPASIATARAYRSLALGDVDDTARFAQQALQLTPEGDQTRYIQATSLLTVAQYAGGDPVAAERSLSDLHSSLRKFGEIRTLIGTTFLLADIRLALGRLNEAEDAYQQSLRIAAGQAELMPIGTADLYRGLGELLVERGDLEAAAQYLLTSQKLGERSATTDWMHRLCMSQARLKEAQGDLDGALGLLEEAERVHVRNPLPDLRPVAALKARVWLKQGRLAEALGWARGQGLSVDDDIRYTREFEYITLARVLMAAAGSDREAGSLDQATRLLGRLLQAAETGGRMGSAIQILLLQALAFQAQDDLPNALPPLERALGLAEPEGYVRTFVDEGETMRLLIKEQSRNRHHPLSGYADRLLAGFTQAVPAPESAITHQRSDMIEPLSVRELEVLKLLRSELTGPEIAQHLAVSLNTLRTHTKSIFSKLGVNNRRAAIRRAEELHLF